MAFVPQTAKFLSATSIAAEKSKSIPFLSAPSNLEGMIGNKGIFSLILGYVDFESIYISQQYVINVVPITINYPDVFSSKLQRHSSIFWSIW